MKRLRKSLRRSLLMTLIGVLLPGVALAQSSHQHALPTTAHVKPSNPQLVTPAIEKRVDALLAKMTLEEKLGQLVQYNNSYNSSAEAVQAFGANPETKNRVDAMQLAASGRLGSMLNIVGAAQTNAFQRAAVEKSRLHIPLMFGADIIHGFRTIYPEPLGLAATFDPALVTKLARMSAEEATTAGVRWFYSPMVDISRDPRWGRTSEGAGEDPYLGSAMAAAYVHGYQNRDLSQPDSVAASVKHFAAYGAAEAGREYNTTDMSQIRLRQVYLPPYHAAVEAGAATVMSSFNALNGVPVTANHCLLTNILRDEWGFDGFVVSDYDAIRELINHGVALDGATAARKAILAGVDVDMMSHLYDAELPALIRSGQVPMPVVNEAVRRVLRVKFALGLFDHPYARGTEVTAPVPAHRPLVRQAAEESFVLLQNKPVQGAPVLPLSSSVHTIALIGPLADSSGAMIKGTADSTAAGVVTVKQALEQRAKQTGDIVLYEKATTVLGNSTSGFAAAVDAARRADLAVLALGESGDMSGEAGSRAHLNLPGNQEQLLQAVAATGKPIVLLVFSGRPLILNWAAKHAAAIMEVWFPGVEAGNAITDLLYGDVSPSGKLPMSFPRAVGQEPLYYAQFPTGRPPIGIDLSQPPGPTTRFFSRYIDVPNSPLFPFGYGLTYTTFAFSNVAVSRASLPLSEADQLSAKNLITVTATIKNTGNRAATEVVQLYIRNLGTSVEQPVRRLRRFERITLNPGESKQVTFHLGFHDLSFYNTQAKEVVEPTHYTVWIGG
ncbi:MAG: glycoside hydrolase family 3 N-terminal domain-containing protein, partial [Acidobacteriaceae bacterium]